MESSCDMSIVAIKNPCQGILRLEIEVQRGQCRDQALIMSILLYMMNDDE